MRHALRTLGRHPVVSASVILTLAVGVGAVTTAFSILRGTLSPLDYPRSGELVRVHDTLAALKDSPNPRLQAMWNQVPVTYSNTMDWRRMSRTLRGIGLYKSHTAVLEPGGEPLEVEAAKVDAELLRALGVQPLLGRAFTASEVQRRQPLVLLGHELWTGVFGGDKGILNRALRLDGQQYTVVGVMPPGFALPGRKDRLWLPAGPTDDDLAYRDDHSYTAIGRLAPGATLAAAQAEMDRIAASLATRYPETNTGTGVRLVPLLETVIGDSRRVLKLLAAAAAVVLLVACVNLALLLLAQGAERRGEQALRLALGARRSNLLRQSGGEILTLAALGSAGGLLLTFLILRLLPALLATELPRLEDVEIDGGVALFALAAGVAAALLSGLLPALFAPGDTPREAMAENRLVRVAQDGLIVAEVALTLMLTAGALALAASWMRLSAVPPGFDTRGVLVQEIRLPAWQYPDDVRRGELASRLLASLQALPGIEGVALTSRLPVAGPAAVWGFEIPGRDAPEGDWTQGRSAAMQFITPGYFRVLRIPLVAGEAFDARSGTGPEKVVMVSRGLAERHWPGASPGVVKMRDQEYRVIGVFEDIRYQGLAEEPGDLMAQPWGQGPAASFAALIRTGGDPLDQAAAVRRKLRELDPSLPLPAAAPLADLVAGSILGPRSRALLVGLSAGVALLLALVGTYGVMAYGISRRRREIAIRMAAGADRRRVEWWVLRRALGLALAGVVLGILGALAAGRLLEGLLYGVEAAGPLTLLPAALLLLVTCLAAGYLPARRASRIDPAAILRDP
ncbi:MAG TPA: ADOP family duplicated permease [Thermoanaerobaculia bacterium]